MSQGTRCTIERRSGVFCDAAAVDWAPFPICERHARMLYRTMDAMLEAAQRDPLLMADLAFSDLADSRRTRIGEHEPDPDPVVYFLLIDGLVKIGHATHLVRRLAHYPPTAQLLATEPGDRSREAQLHAEFAEYLTAGREWFTPGPRLRAYIEGLDGFQR